MVITASRTMNEMDGGHLAAETAHRLLVITQMNADCPRRRKNGASTCVDCVAVCCDYSVHCPGCHQLSIISLI